MLELWNSTYFQLGLWGSILLMLLLVAYLVVRKFRDSAVGNDNHPGFMLTNFREMKLQGDIDDAEFRTIKSLLDGKPPPQVNDMQ